ncbi:DUF1330 domain-containing protein [Streptomyces sp. TLI_105]|uniref:DUF1330 domain-containing protein n=1 Tax=Streptomyces sp. TLI_105 TaxID=1881019 RepID=UPI000B87B9AB|nr:DUF1330 domain-containing protein [Streptomyces sp. TLI_105]
MTASAIADVQLTGDAEEPAECRSKVVATPEPYGGRYLARGGDIDVVEGAWTPGQIVPVESPGVAAARARNESVEHQAIAPPRIGRVASTTPGKRCSRSGARQESSRCLPSWRVAAAPKSKPPQACSASLTGPGRTPGPPPRTGTAASRSTG